jgi:hypothetical protein
MENSIERTAEKGAEASGAIVSMNTRAFIICAVIIYKIPEMANPI